MSGNVINRITRSTKGNILIHRIHQGGDKTGNTKRPVLSPPALHVPQITSTIPHQTLQSNRFLIRFCINLQNKPCFVSEIPIVDTDYYHYWI